MAKKEKKEKKKKVCEHKHTYYDFSMITEEMYWCGASPAVVCKDCGKVLSPAKW